MSQRAIANIRCLCGEFVGVAEGERKLCPTCKKVELTLEPYEDDYRPWAYVDENCNVSEFPYQEPWSEWWGYWDEEDQKNWEVAE